MSLMDIKNTITILIPLKGRNNYTKRLLNYFAARKFPFKIILADGSSKNNKNLFDKKNYPKLNLEYYYFGDDSNVNKYMSKMAQASRKINTPLTMICDSDDFISLDGVLEGIRFLSNNNDYASYRGAYLNWGRKKNIYKEPSIISDDIFERVEIMGDRYNACWNNITRTNIVKSFFDVCDKSQTNDLQCVIRLSALWQAMFGNIFRCLDKPFYYHMPTPTIVQTGGVYSKFNKWYKNKTFSTSAAIILSALSNVVYKQSNKSL